MSLQQQLKELISVSPRPDDFFQKAMFLRKDIEEIIPEVEELLEEMIAVADVFNCCALGMNQCSQNKNFSEGFKWETLHKALTSIGVKSKN